jgi:hypothetical protein
MAIPFHTEISEVELVVEIAYVRSSIFRNAFFSQIRMLLTCVHTYVAKTKITQVALKKALSTVNKFLGLDKQILKFMTWTLSLLSFSFSLSLSSLSLSLSLSSLFFSSSSLSLSLLSFSLSPLFLSLSPIFLSLSPIFLFLSSLSLSLLSFSLSLSPFISLSLFLVFFFCLS